MALLKYSMISEWLQVETPEVYGTNDNRSHLPLRKQGDTAMNIMNVTVSVNFWFIVTLCLISLIIGLLVGAAHRASGHSDRHFRY
jgi:hypothetical protein